jgi:hypothetical protein
MSGCQARRMRRKRKIKSAVELEVHGHREAANGNIRIVKRRISQDGTTEEQERSDEHECSAEIRSQEGGGQSYIDGCEDSILEKSAIGTPSKAK